MEPTKPRPFSPSNEIETPREWQRWKKEFLNYLRLSGGYDDCSEEERALFLQNIMGLEAIKAMEKMTFDHDNEKKDMDILLMKFDEIFDPPANEVEERFKFFSRTKNEKESIDHYVDVMERIATKCNFGEQTSKFIIDMIVLSMDSYLRKSIFTLQDLTLSDLIIYFKNYELNNQRIKELSKDMVQDSNLKNAKEKEAGSSIKKVRSTNYCRKCHKHHNPAVDCKKEPAKDQTLKEKRICSKCGSNHPYKQCPAFDNICQNCSTKGHYTTKCKQAKLCDVASSVPVMSPEEKKNSDETLFCASKQNFCNWCESRHVQGNCQHNPHCTKCKDFPHKICFNCKKNPHDLNCYYKSIITLPSKNIMNNEKSTENQQDGTRSTMSTPPHKSDPDPLLKNYVTINKPSQLGQTKFQQPRQTFSTPRYNSSQSFKPNQKKNDKDDKCNIS